MLDTNDHLSPQTGQERNGIKGEETNHQEEACDSGVTPTQVEEDKGASQKIEALEKELASTKDQLLRALAEVENTRRRLEREREETAKYAITKFAREVISIADNLARALESTQKDQQEKNLEALLSLISGIEITQKELSAILEKSEIKPVNPLGEKFNPALHQAMFEVPSEDKEPGTIVQVIQVGYTIYDRLLRPALVGVAKAAPKKDVPNEMVEENGVAS